MKIRNYKANYLFPKLNIPAHKFFGPFFKPIDSMFHDCGSLDIQAFT